METFRINSLKKHNKKIISVLIFNNFLMNLELELFSRAEEIVSSPTELSATP